MRHIVEHEDIPGHQRTGKGVIADHVAREAGRPTEAVGVKGLDIGDWRLEIGGITGEAIAFSFEGDGGLRRADVRAAFDEKHIGAVGHLDHVRHVGGGGDIEDGELVAGGFEDIHHLRAEHAGVDRNGFAGLQPDLDVVSFPRLADEPDEELAVVERLGDPMPATHVQVGELLAAEEMAEFFVHRLERALEIRRVLFAEGVEMKAGKPGEICAFELIRCDSEP